MYDAVEEEVVRFKCEAEHVKAVSDIRALPVAASLLRGYTQEGCRLVFHTPEKARGRATEQVRARLNRQRD